LLYPFNYENKCRIFGLFSLFSGYGDLLYNSYQLLDELPFSYLFDSSWLLLYLPLNKNLFSVLGSVLSKT